MNKILQKVTRIIDKAINDEEFLSEYSNNLIATGERSVDYSAYCIDLDENYYLIIDFVDFSFSDFSIVHKSQETLINRLSIEHI